MAGRGSPDPHPERPTLRASRRFGHRAAIASIPVPRLVIAALIIDIQAPGRVRWKRSFVYRCRWSQEWPGLEVSGRKSNVWADRFPLG